MSNKLITALDLTERFSFELLTGSITNEKMNLDSGTDKLYKCITESKRVLDRKLFITPKNVISSLELDNLFDKSTKAHRLKQIEMINLAIFAYNIFKGREYEECIDAFFEKIIFQDELATAEEINFYVNLRHVALANYMEENNITEDTEVEQAIEDFFPLNSELMSFIPGKTDYNVTSAVKVYREELEKHPRDKIIYAPSSMEFKVVLTDFVRTRYTKIISRSELPRTLLITNTKANPITSNNTSSIGAIYEVTPVLPEFTGNKIASVISKKAEGRKLSEREVFSQAVEYKQPVTTSGIKELGRKELFKASTDADEDELTATNPTYDVSSGTEESDEDAEDDFSNLGDQDVGTIPPYVQETDVHDKDDVEARKSPQIQHNKRSRDLETEVINADEIQVKKSKQAQVNSVDSSDVDQLDEDSQDEASQQDTEAKTKRPPKARDAVVNDLQNNKLDEDTKPIDTSGSPICEDVYMGDYDDSANDEPNGEDELPDAHNAPEAGESYTNDDENNFGTQPIVAIENSPAEFSNEPNEPEISPSQLSLQPIQKMRKVRKTTEPWTEEEVKALEEGLNTLRRPYWADIKRLVSPVLDRRSGPSLKDKARTMIRQLKKAGFTSPEEMGAYRYVITPDADKKYDKVLQPR